MVSKGVATWENNSEDKANPNEITAKIQRKITLPLLFCRPVVKQCQLN